MWEVLKIGVSVCIDAIHVKWKYTKLSKGIQYFLSVRYSFPPIPPSLMNPDLWRILLTQWWIYVRCNHISPRHSAYMVCLTYFLSISCGYTIFFTVLFNSPLSCYNLTCKINPILSNHRFKKTPLSKFLLNKYFWYNEATNCRVEGKCLGG